MSIKKDSVVFIASGATAGAGVSATIGTMGLVGGFGGVAIGMTPVTAAGAVAGAATYGAFKAIENRDTLALGAVGIGAVAGAKVSSTIGGMGLAGSFGAVDRSVFVVALSSPSALKHLLLTWELLTLNSKTLVRAGLVILGWSEKG